MPFADIFFKNLHGNAIKYGWVRMEIIAWKTASSHGCVCVGDSLELTLLLVARADKSSTREESLLILGAFRVKYGQTTTPL